MESQDITLLLQRIGEGDRDAWDAALEALYGTLHGLAHRMMRDQDVGHTLQTTALLHEALLKVHGGAGGWETRQHFERVAARAMRHVLVDHARARNADKRGGPGKRKVEIEESRLDGGGELDLDVLALHEAIEKLQELDEEAAQVAELRCFGGLEHEDIAKVLGCSGRTVERRWRFVRSWLENELGLPADGEPPSA